MPAVPMRTTPMRRGIIPDMMNEIFCGVVDICSQIN
jgi:hypothetical protein